MSQEDFSDIERDFQTHVFSLFMSLYDPRRSYMGPMDFEAEDDDEDTISPEESPSFESALCDFRLKSALEDDRNEREMRLQDFCDQTIEIEQRAQELPPEATLPKKQVSIPKPKQLPKPMTDNESSDLEFQYKKEKKEEEERAVREKRQKAAQERIARMEKKKEEDRKRREEEERKTKEARKLVETKLQSPKYKKVKDEEDEPAQQNDPRKKKENMKKLDDTIRQQNKQKVEKQKEKGEPKRKKGFL